MNYWRSELGSVARNLACDEILLHQAEQNADGAWLRFWMTHRPTVVLGYSNRVEREIDSNYCRDHGIDINRRISGGGTVWLGAGCLCYSLILPIVSGTPFEHLATSNRFIMETHRDALQRLSSSPVQVNGITDLSVGGRKFSGNSQKRGRHALLFHGTILWDADLLQIHQCLQHPPIEPDWRQRRPHSEFVGNFPADHSKVEQALVNAWSASPAPVAVDPDELDRLTDEKYHQERWWYCR